LQPAIDVIFSKRRTRYGYLQATFSSLALIAISAQDYGLTTDTDMQFTTCVFLFGPGWTGLAVVALFAQSFTYIASRKSSGQKKTPVITDVFKRVKAYSFSPPTGS
jgi:hypothetical protein